MTAPMRDQDRPEPPQTADEAATLLGFLDFLRGTLLWKCSGLDDEQLHAAPLPSSQLTLAGLLKHLAYVEDWWFGCVLAGREPGQPWRDVDWDADPDWDWHSAAEQDADALVQLWQQAVGNSRADWQGAQAAGATLDTVRPANRGRQLSVRWVLTHMVEEYARHCGHADLLREALDGATGE